jgi:hypothetical protein
MRRKKSWNRDIRRITTGVHGDQITTTGIVADNQRHGSSALSPFHLLKEPTTTATQQDNLALDFGRFL